LFDKRRSFAIDRNAGYDRNRDQRRERHDPQLLRASRKRCDFSIARNCLIG
jgi:hypothetical protein